MTIYKLDTLELTAVPFYHLSSAYTLRNHSKHTPGLACSGYLFSHRYVTTIPVLNTSDRFP
jgi:hypothetical protein